MIVLVRVIVSGAVTVSVSVRVMISGMPLRRHEATEPTRVEMRLPAVPRRRLRMQVRRRRQLPGSVAHDQQRR